MKKTRLIFAAAAAAAVTISAAPAGATVVDFNGYGPGINCVMRPLSDSSGGLTFETLFAVCEMGAGSEQPGKADNGTGFFINGYSDLVVTGPASFVLNALDIGQSYFSASEEPITITRYLVGGGTDQTFVTSTDAFQTVGFSDAAITGFRVSGFAGYFALDNIVYDSGAVPEPAAWALMILGFGGAGAMLRRRAVLA